MSDSHEAAAFPGATIDGSGGADSLDADSLDEDSLDGDSFDGDSFDADSLGALGSGTAGDANALQQARARVLEGAGDGSVAHSKLRRHSALGVFGGRCYPPWAAFSPA